MHDNIAERKVRRPSSFLPLFYGRPDVSLPEVILCLMTYYRTTKQKGCGRKGSDPCKCNSILRVNVGLI
jgi:hypothetical protein